MENHYLTIWDLVLSPLYLVVLLFIAKRIRDKHYPHGHPLRRYYLPGLLVKFAGAIFIALIYQFYYKSGDTFNYFTHARIINSALPDSVNIWLRLLFAVSPDNDPYIYRYSSQLYWYNDAHSYLVGVIAAILGLLNGTTYIPIALLFAFFSFTGIWAMFRTFVRIYPSLHKQLAIPFLFIPGAFVWGSAIFKDTICMFALGWITHSVFSIFIEKNRSVKNIALAAFSFYLLAVIKIYILMAFLPALSMWLLMNYSDRIYYRALRWATNIIVIGLSVGGLILVSQSFSEELGRYSLDELAHTAKVTETYISNASEEGGSAYDLGSFEPTIGGMLVKFPQAVTVTLFRPFLWEVKKPIMLLSALESLVVVVLFLYILFKKGLKTIFRSIASDPNLLFLFIFSLIFAFAVGISTGNFGTLSRYKIPCMPFFISGLFILYYKDRLSQKVFIADLGKKNLMKMA